MKKELNNDLRELMDKYNDLDLERETVVGVTLDFAEAQDEAYGEHRDWLSRN